MEIPFQVGDGFSRRLVSSQTAKGPAESNLAEAVYVKYEYMEERMNGMIDLSRLNDLGEQGWELCGIASSETALVLVFKRHKPVHV